MHLCTSIFSVASLLSIWARRVCLHDHGKKHAQLPTYEIVRHDCDSNYAKPGMPLNILIHGLQTNICLETYSVVGTCGSQVKVHGDNYWQEHKLESSSRSTLDLQARSDDATYVFEKKQVIGVELLSPPLVLDHPYSIHIVVCSKGS